jgi:hypothetical protein
LFQYYQAILCSFPKEIWAPFCVADEKIKQERTNNILERFWEDLKKTIQSNNLNPFHIISELQKFGNVKMADMERRLIGSRKKIDSKKIRFVIS